MNKANLNNLQDNLENIIGSPTLAQELESCSKHLSSYLRVIKKHIEQLKQLMAQHNKTFNPKDFPQQIQQLITIFETMQPDDLETIEKLAKNAKHFQMPVTTE